MVLQRADWKGERNSRAIATLPESVFEFFAPMPFPMLQSMFDGLYTPGLQWYWKADFVKELSDEAIALHVKAWRGTPDAALHDASVSGQWGRAQGGEQRNTVEPSGCRVERSDCRCRSGSGEQGPNHRMG